MVSPRWRSPQRQGVSGRVLIIGYGLKPGVVNVLIDYILKTNNNKLTRNLAETIAGQWQRLKIETVDEAMRVAEKEHKKYKKTTFKIPFEVHEGAIPEDSLEHEVVISILEELKVEISKAQADLSTITG